MKRERYFYERDEEGNPTGVTICSYNEQLGYAFLFPGKFEVDSFKHSTGEAQTNILELVPPDNFNKVLGRKVALGRAQKVARLVEAGKTPEEAMSEVYSKRMINRINQYKMRRATKLVLKDLREAGSTGTYASVEGAV